MLGDGELARSVVCKAVVVEYTVYGGVKGCESDTLTLGVELHLGHRSTLRKVGRCEAERVLSGGGVLKGEGLWVFLALPICDAQCVAHFFGERDGVVRGVGYDEILVSRQRVGDFLYKAHGVKVKRRWLKTQIMIKNILCGSGTLWFRQRGTWLCPQ